MAGASYAALAVACCLPSAAVAGTYTASSPAELNTAITNANADPDAAAIILLTSSFVTSGALTVPTKPIAIDTQGFTLFGPASSGVAISGAGAVRTLAGTFMGSDGGASAAAVQMRNGASVANMGLVQGGTASSGGGGAGVDFGGPGAATTLSNHGTIRGGAGSSGGIGVYVRNGAGQIINTGTIEGGAGGSAIAANAAAASIDIINSGAIRAGAGADAIGWVSVVTPTTGRISLELQAGSAIEGGVVANATALTDVLRLGGTADSTFDVSAIGATAQYQNFDVFEKTGASTWALIGEGAAVTNWSIQEGMLQLGDGGTSGSIIGDVANDGGTSGSIIGDVANDGALAFNRSNELTFDGVISGTGSVAQIGAGTTILSAVNTYAGGTFLNGGALSVANDASLGDGAGALSFDGGALQVTGTAFSITARTINWGAGGGFDIADAANSFTVAQALSSGGALVKLGDGALVLTSDNAYTGGTTVSAGTLQIGDGRATGAIVGDVANNGALAFNRSDAITFSGAVLGSGELLQIGGGTTILTGANTYTGGTAIGAGTLQIGDGGTSGAILGDVANDGALAFNRSDAVLFDGAISGGGVIRHTGAGTTTLTADSSAFTGLTTVEAGTLSVNGILGGAIDVETAARLMGVGEVGATTNAGVIAPGNSIGVLTINGDYAGNGGALEIEAVLAETGSPADRLLITGDAAGMTTVYIVNLGGAGAPTGTSSAEGISIIQVAGDSTAGVFQLAGGYVAAGPYQYHLNAFDPASSADAEMDNGLASAGAAGFWDYRLQSALDDSGDPIPVPQVPGYQALPSGALQFGWTILDSLHKRLGEIRPTAGAGSAGDANAELFLRGSGEHGDFNGDNGPDYDQTTWFTQAGGNVVGWDVGGEGGALRGGLAVSYGGSKLDVASSSAQVDLVGASVALTTTYQAPKGWRLDAVAMGTRYNAEVTTDERGVTGDPDGWGAGFSLEGGYPVDLDSGVTLEPQMQLVYQRVWFEEFTDVDDIMVDLQGGDSLRWRVGARLQKTFVSANGGQRSLWSPYAQIDVINELLDGDSINAAGVEFGTDVGGSSVRASGGIEARVGSGLALYANAGYEAGVGRGSADSFGGDGGVRLSF